MKGRKVLASTMILIVGIGLGASVTIAATRHVLARDAAHFRDVAQALLQSEDWSRHVDDFGVPPALRAREEAVIHYYLLAAELDPSGAKGADLLLGIYFLEEDCEIAKHYLRKQQERTSAAGDVDRLLAVAEREGCPAALKWLRQD